MAASTRSLPRLRALLATAGLAIGLMIAPSTAQPTSAELLVDPTISARVKSGTVQFNGDWSGAPMSITIDGKSHGTDYSYDDCAFGCDGLPVEYGSEISVSDGTTTKHLTVSPLAISGVHAPSNTVTGVAESGDTVDVWVLVDGPGAGLTTAADTNGAWTADLTAVATLSGHGQGEASVTDDDGDQTIAHWSVPVLAVELSGAVIGQGNWYVGDNIDVEIRDVDDDYVKDFDVTAEAWDHFGDSWRINNVGEFGAGYKVIASDQHGTRKEHIARPLTIDPIDTAKDVVSGTTVSGAGDEIDVHADDCSRQLTPNQGHGTFVADFADPSGGDTCDLTESSAGEISQFDIDGDFTHLWWGDHGSAPWIIVLLGPFGTGIGGNTFGTDGPFIVTLDDPATPDADPDTTEHDPDETWIVPDDFPEGGASVGDGFWLDGPFQSGSVALTPGHVVTVTDTSNGTYRQHTIRALTYDDVDVDASTVSGWSGSPEVVDVSVGNPEQWRTPQVSASDTPDGNGNWMVDFSSFVEVQPLTGLEGQISISDNDDTPGDQTGITWGPPFIAAGIDVEGDDPHSIDSVWGGYWFHDDRVEMRVTDADGNPKYGPVVGDVDKSWWNGFEFPPLPIDLVSGDTVSVEGLQSGDRQVHTVLDFQVQDWEWAAFDDDGNRLLDESGEPIGNRIWGTAQPTGHLGIVRVGIDDDSGRRLVDVDSEGNWEVDFDQPLGYGDWGEDVVLVPGRGGRVELRGFDGNLAWALWGEHGGGGGHDGPPVVQAYVDEEYIRGEGWLPGGVFVTLYDSEGGVPIVMSDGALFENVEIGVEEDGTFWYEMGEIEQGLEPGMFLEVRSGDVTKTLTIAAARFDAFDPASDTVFANTPELPIDEARLHLFDQDGNQLDDGEGGPIVVTSPTLPAWSYPLGLSGDGVDGLTEARLEVPDAGDGDDPAEFDGDGTFGQLPYIRTSAQYDSVQSDLFDNDTTVTVEVFRDENGDGTRTRVWNSGGLPHPIEVSLRGDFHVSPESGLDPGDEVVVTGTTTGVVKRHIVDELGIDEIDIQNDRVTGTASPWSLVRIGVGNDWCGYELMVTADVAGHWIADFGAEPPCDESAEFFDITEDMGVEAAVIDPDMDRTVAWPPEPPRVVVDPFRERVRAQWFPEGELTLEITTPEGESVLPTPLKVMVDGAETVFDLMMDVTPWVDIQTGHLITVTHADGDPATDDIVHQFRVAHLGVEFVDDEADVIYGSTDPGGSLLVFVGNETGGEPLWIDANTSDGSWTADVAVDIDKTVGWTLFMSVPDGDDATVYEPPQATPGTAVFPEIDLISSEGSGLGPITLSVRDAEGTLLHSSTDEPRHGRYFSYGEFEFDIFAADPEVHTYGRKLDLSGVVDLAPDMVVTAEHVLWEMTVVIQELTVDAVNTETDTVSGTIEHPGLVMSVVSGPEAFGFLLEPPDLTIEWTMGLTTIGADPQRYDITSETIGITSGGDQHHEVAPFDTYTSVVWDLRPHLTELVLPVDPVDIDTPVGLTASFTDIEVSDRHTALIDWGDGVEPETVAVAPGTFEFDAAHLYDEPGIYTVTLTVADEYGHTDTAIHQFVVVYDPDGGFVTGGGWIDSPTGAYTLDPELTGQANFGFVAKYKKGQITPDGNTNFQFEVAGLHFRSTSYDWLVISGEEKAKYKGDGTINGEGDYGFMLTAMDREDGDSFRIKIWDNATGDVVYDNLSIDGDDGYDGTALGGGSIVIHTGKK